MELVLHSPSYLPRWDAWVASGREELVVPMTPDQEFEKFFIAHFDRLVRSVTAITGDADVATDAVQEAFIKAYARWSRVGKYDQPMLWVRRVAINKSRDSRRSFLRRRAREDRFDETAVVEEGVNWESEPNVDIVSALHDLSPRQRSVAALFYLEDLSISEIAASLDLSTGAVKFHLSKARTSLRALLDVEEGVQDD